MMRVWTYLKFKTWGEVVESYCIGKGDAFQHQVPHSLGILYLYSLQTKQANVYDP